MKKKKTWSTLLSLIVTLSVLISYAGTVMADPVDPDQGNPSAQTEETGAQDPAEPADPEEGDEKEESADQADSEKPEDPAGQEKQGNPDVAKAPAVRGVGDSNDAEGQGESGQGTAGQGESGQGTSGQGGEAEISKEECGGYHGSINWNFKNAVITLTGSGSMDSGFSEGDFGWSDLKNDVTSIVIGEGITSIGDYAFLGFSKATSLTLPSSGLTVIGDYAFMNCGFTSVSMPDTITTIGTYAFAGCSSITYMHISEIATSIGEYAFSGCNFQSTNMPYNLTTISNGMFKGCSSLYSVFLPSSVTSIGERAFAECSNLNNFSMTESHVTSIGARAFENSGIQSIIIPDGVTVINEQTFSGCNNLELVTLSANLTKIGDKAFYNCSKISEITIPGSVTNIHSAAFVGCSILETVHNNADPDKLAWSTSAGAFIPGKGTTCIVPSRYYETYIAKFGDLNLTFRSRFIAEGTCGQNLTWMLDGDGTMIISGTGPMYDYSSNDQSLAGENADRIKTVIIDNGVTSIGQYAFYNCYSMETISLPESVTSIGTYAFAETHNLDSIVLPAGLTTLETYAFYNSGIRSVNIPSGITTIPERAFSCCSRLEAIVIPNTVETLETNALSYCYNLKAITIPSSISSWGKYTFYECTSLTSVTVCEGITSIPYGTFYECRSLSEVNLPDSLTTIEGAAFYVDPDYNIGSIQSIALPSNLTSIGNWAFAGQGLRSVTIPGSMHEVASDTFNGCPGLNSITVLNGTTKINEGAFNYCQMIKSVTIPSSVTFVDHNAFYEGYYMEDIYLYPDPANLDFFFDPDISNLNSNTKIHVLQEYLSEYQRKFDRVADQFVGDLDPNGEGLIDIGTGVHLYGYNLSLAGDIGVNFWFKIADNYLDPDNFIKFTVNGQEQIVKVSEASDDPSGSGAKIFRCSVVAKQMSDTITAQFYTANGFPDGTSYSYSIKEYANYILTHNYTDKDKNIAKTMLNYGACAQKYFNYNADSLANTVLPASDREVTIRDYTTIQTGSGSQTYIEPLMVSLVLNTTVSLKLYFRPSDLEGLTVKSGNTVLEKTTNGEFVSVRIDNISAAAITSPIGIQFFSEDNTFAGQTMYCPSQCIRLILSQPADDPVYTDDLKRLVSALYDFNRALRS